MFEIKIKDKTLKYTVKHRNVKYIRFELNKNKLKLILPVNYSGDIKKCIYTKEDYLYKKLIEYEELTEKLEKQIKDKELIKRSIFQLKDITNFYINQYQKQLDVKVNRLQFRKTTRKWGSCSTKSNITLSKDLIYLPEKLVAYVIYHELVHLIVFEHNFEFFNIIKKEYPDYKKYDEELKEYEYLIHNKK